MSTVKSRKELLAEEYATPPYSPIGNSIKNPIEPIGNRNSNVDIDRALADTSDLIDNPKYKGWFANQARRLGVDRYLGIAREARTDRNQPTGRLFVSKLKRA